MKAEWNLNVIYKDFSDPAFMADLEALQEVVAGFNAFSDGLKEMSTLEGLRGGIAWEERLMKLGRKLACDPRCGGRCPGQGSAAGIGRCQL